MNTATGMIFGLLAGLMVSLTMHVNIGLALSIGLCLGLTAGSAAEGRKGTAGELTGSGNEDGASEDAMSKDKE